MRLSKLSAFALLLCVAGGCAIHRDNNRLDLTIGRTALGKDGTADAIVHIGFLATVDGENKGLSESFKVDPLHVVPFGVKTVRGWIAEFAGE